VFSGPIFFNPHKGPHEILRTDIGPQTHRQLHLKTMDTDVNMVFISELDSDNYPDPDIF
jgi:hypothetical protein